ncbi:UDP-glucuronosyltransferase 2C1-like [Nasonia vitripennis]|uniref:Glucuronosyltransferase n=1 Tax=Nasonia vitripennis TaxID=7425 RepID=A0A7M7PZJ4_NASVI|nr:UDP-glucuronosyltransferase 2C1-like [Nasonia vitripennis]XP_031777617.1 UDP-glucuronosyltransferase 2C1-like [Nasonia vitripennis]
MSSSKRAPCRTATSLVALLLIGLQSGVNCLRILAIFPLNSYSHSAMCHSLAKGLTARGHELDVYSFYRLKNPPPNYRGYSLARGLTDFSNNMSYDIAMQLQPSLSPSSMKNAFEKIGTPICRLMELPVFNDLREKNLKDGPYDLVIVEVFMADCYLAWGRHLNIPMVGVATRPLIDGYNDALGNPFNSAVTPGSNTGFQNPMNFWERLVNTITSKLLNMISRYFMAEQDIYVERIFGPGYPTVSELEKDLDLLLINSHLSLEDPSAITPAIIPVAGIHIADDDTKLPEGVQQWLDDSVAGCIYFSFGSMVVIESFPKPMLKAFYDSFKDIAPMRVLWKIDKPQLLPDGLPANVMTQKWFAQNQVLKHKNTKVFVTHGGLMSSQEAIQFGVPMVGIPIFGDQHQNVDVNVKRGISTKVTLSELMQETFTKAITELIRNPTYRKNSEKLKNLFMDRPMSPMDTAVYWVEYIGRHGKNALRSPLVDMPWYQKKLLDVYGFILLTLYAIYFVMKLLVKTFFGIIFKKNCKHNTASRSRKSAKKES